jgi:hypothetical protein
MSEITVEPSLSLCGEIWKLYVEGKSHAAIADYIGLPEDELWRIYRYLNLHIKANINPDAGDGATQFFVLWERYNSQYEACCEDIKTIKDEIKDCESPKDKVAFMRAKTAAISQMTVITKHLQGLLGMDTINVRLLTEFEQKKEGGKKDYSEMTQNELMQELTKKLQG